jgi:uncharacterized protein YprB with RNaseH-like and TPR domain
MNLREKLIRLEKTTPVTRSERPKTRTPDLSRLLPGGIRENELGSCWRNQVQFGLEHCHGSFRLKEFLENNPEHLQLVGKSQNMNGLSLDRLLFIDTETTGLSGGVGTIAFLVGLGYFEGDRFVIEQYFLRRFEEERPVLHEVLERLDRLQSSRGAVVSFNGKSYDLPLLFNRGIYHRLCDAPFSFPHIDILHPSRRLWKKHLRDCSLNTLEAEVLRLSRQGDIPGHLIPTTYFRYLRSADPRPMLPVFYHNQMDILSMVSLLNLFLKLIVNQCSGESLSIDWLGMGGVFEAMGDYERGLSFYSEVLHRKITDEERKSVLLRLARIHKKVQDYKGAMKAWEEAIRCKGFSIEPYEELAKVYEHRVVDLGKAKAYTVRALENLDLLVKINGRGSHRREKDELMRRLKRINKRLTQGDEQKATSAGKAKARMHSPHDG